MNSRRADAIRKKLEQMIIEGIFADGERLDEIKLAECFSVSRTPLREAFQTLAASGLLDLQPHRGAFVRYPTFEETIEMFEVMAELEAFCGRLAARRATPELIAKLAATVDTCEKAVAANDYDAYYSANETFHLLIYQAAGNRFLETEAARLHRRLKPFRRMQLQARGRMAQSLAEHRQILAAIQAGETQITADTLRDHVAIQGTKFNDLVASYRQSTAVRVAI